MSFHELQFSAVSLSLYESVRHIKGDKVWAEGFTGKGVKVAIVDTGVKSTHPMLVGKVVAAQSFIPGEPAEDEHGHGSWCGSCVAGNKVVVDGKELSGVAHEAQLINAKGLSKQGSGTLTGLIQALEWAADQGAQVFSCSWGASSDIPAIRDVIKGIKEQTGAIFVFAAGNSGPSPGSMNYPGAYPEVLTVGAIALQAPSPNSVATFSSRGPTSDGRIKPDICAPGGNRGPDECIIAAGVQGYVCWRGTSMATPHIAGVIALLKQGSPNQKEVELFDRLQKSALDIGAPGKDNDSGYGVADAYGAFKLGPTPPPTPPAPAPELEIELQGELKTPVGSFPMTLKGTGKPRTG